jgi:hypothetical protein
VKDCAVKGLAVKGLAVKGLAARLEVASASDVALRSSFSLLNTANENWS